MSPAIKYPRPRVGSLMRMNIFGFNPDIVLILEYEKLKCVGFVPQRVKVLCKEKIFWAWVEELCEVWEIEEESGD